MQLDRLSIIHQLVAKVAAVIGNTTSNAEPYSFSFEQLCGAWPVFSNSYPTVE